MGGGVATFGTTGLFCIPGGGITFCVCFCGTGAGVGAGDEEVEAVGLGLAIVGPDPPSLANRFKRIYIALVSGMAHKILKG